MSQDVYEKGLGIRREVLGADYVERAMENTDEFGADFQRFVTEYCWGGCWGRDALPRPTRSLLVLAILATSGRWEEFELHFRAALGNGCSDEELRDTLFHVAVYAGVPSGVSAFRIARKVLAEERPAA